jgi:hypothetical protein
VAALMVEPLPGHQRVTGAWAGRIGKPVAAPMGESLRRAEPVAAARVPAAHWPAVLVAEPPASHRQAAGVWAGRIGRRLPVAAPMGESLRRAEPVAAARVPVAQRPAVLVAEPPPSHRQAAGVWAGRISRRLPVAAPIAESLHRAEPVTAARVPAAHWPGAQVAEPPHGTVPVAERAAAAIPAQPPPLQPPPAASSAS